MPRNASRFCIASEGRPLITATSTPDFISILMPSPSLTLTALSSSPSGVRYSLQSVITPSMSRNRQRIFSARRRSEMAPLPRSFAFFFTACSELVEQPLDYSRAQQVVHVNRAGELAGVVQHEQRGDL